MIILTLFQMPTVQHAHWLPGCDNIIPIIPYFTISRALMRRHSGRYSIVVTLLMY